MLRPARSERRRQDHDDRDPRRTAARRTPAMSKCSACDGRTMPANCGSGSASSFRKRSSPDKLTVEETLRLFRSFYTRGRTIDELLQIVELEGKRSQPGRQAVGRPEAAAGARLRARRRSRPAVPRRADHRPRPAVAAPALDAARAVPGARRHDSADHPLHGRSRVPLRPRGHRRSRPRHRAGHAARS